MVNFDETQIEIFNKMREEEIELMREEEINTDVCDDPSIDIELC